LGRSDDYLGGRQLKYTVHQLAEMSGVTVRTLHYYDKIGLLQPSKRQDNNYRLYDETEVDILQQIILYRKIGFSLKQIKEIMEDTSFNRTDALMHQLEALISKRNELEQTIATVQKTLLMIDGKEMLSDNEKFIGLKKTFVEMNEKAFGKELRNRYGDNMVNGSKEKIIGLNQVEWSNLIELEELILKLLKDAFFVGNPKSELAMKVCELHKEWISLQWKDGTYSSEAHMALVEGYVCDERFTAYYDKIGEGGTIFLRDAMKFYLGI